MKKLSLLLLILLFNTVSCVPHNTRYVNTYVPRVEWPTLEYSKLDKIDSKESDIIVTGQAFLRTRGGDVITGAGAKVMLNPVTSYSTQFVDITIKKTNGICTLDPVTPDIRIFDYVRITTADASGRFKFKHVPEGKYYLYTAVTWETPSASRHSQGLSLQGGWVYKELEVTKDADNEFILTR